MKENFNAALIRAIRETAPSGENLANALMDILCIGKEAVYRRLRGEVTFTFEEAGIIAHHSPSTALPEQSAAARTSSAWVSPLPTTRWQPTPHC